MESKNTATSSACRAETGEIRGLLDLASPSFFANPYPWYSRLQEANAVHRCEAWSAWVVTGYDDVLGIPSDPATFSNASKLDRLLAELVDRSRGELCPMRDHYAAGGLINSDPPTHTRLRKLVGQPFSPRLVKAMAPRIQAIVERLLEPLLQRGEGDLIEDLAYPLPAIVIAELLGAPSEDRGRFKGWSDAITAFLGIGRVDLPAARGAQAALLEMKDYLGTLLDRRSGGSSTSLLERLARAEGEDGSLTRDELLGTCVTLLIAGHETTTNLIGNAAYLLAGQPALLDQLKADPTRLAAAIEEVLRFESPVHSLKRVARRDTVVRNQRVAKGELIYLILGAANRDPDRFKDPHRFDIDRHDSTRHLAFGHGIHFCLGATLARLEAEIALAAILRCADRGRMSLVGEPRWHPSVAVRGFGKLEVQFSPQGRGAAGGAASGT